MTSATEELLRLLDERGVEFKTHDVITGKAVTWHGSICNWVALPDERGLAVGVYKDYLTPEQAIAATLGSERESELKDALNDVAEKWAIAQVQAADSARRCRLLEALVRDWQELYENPDYGECVRLTDRTRKLGIEVEQ